MEIVFGDWKLRRIAHGDEESLARYANNRNVSINLRDGFPHPYTLDDAREYIQGTIDQNPLTSFAIASDQEFIGGITLHLQSDVAKRSAEIGYWLGEPHWGKGIATAALQALVEYAFAEFDLVRLYAHVFEWNTASVRVLEKAGFSLEARMRKAVTKDGQTIDEFLYALVRDE